MRLLDECEACTYPVDVRIEHEAGRVTGRAVLVQPPHQGVNNGRTPAHRVVQCRGRLVQVTQRVGHSGRDRRI
jgi:hypothetical protein